MATLVDEPPLPFAARAGDTPGVTWPARALAVLKARWWVVLAAVLVAVLGAVLYLRSATYLYTATLRVAPAPSSNRDPRGAGALGNLAALAGLPGGAPAATPFALYLEGVFTREVADRLARRDTLMRTIFAQEWDARRRAWRAPSSFVRDMKVGAFNILGIPQTAWRPPDGARLRDVIMTSVIVQQSVKSPLVTVTFDAPDGAFAARFLGDLHRVTDDYLREKAAQRTRNNVAYLQQKLREVTLVEQRQALFAALSDEERQLMLANNAAPYAADPFGLVNVSSGPTKPRAIVLLLAATVIGLGGGAVLALLLGPPRRRADGDL